MPLVAFRKSTGLPINDFYSNATAEGLTNNALRSGILAADIEVREVSEADYWALQDAMFKDVRAQEAAKIVALDAQAGTLQQQLRLSDADVKALAWLLMRKGG